MRGLKVSEVIKELTEFIETHGDLYVMSAVRDDEKKEITIDTTRKVTLENYEGVYYCEIG